MNVNKLSVDSVESSSGVSPAIAAFGGSANNFTNRQTRSFGAALTSAAVVTLGTDGNSFHLTAGAVTTITDFTHITGSGPFLLVVDSVLTFKHAAGVLETLDGRDVVTKVGDRLRLDQDSDGTTWLLSQIAGVSASSVDTPSITSPLVGATGVIGAITSSAYVAGMHYYGVHIATDWEVASDANFTTIVSSSINDTVNLVSYSPTGLLPTTLYYARVRYRSDRFISDWSTVVDYTTSVAFIDTPVVTVTGSPSTVGGQPTIGGGVFTVTGSTDTQVSADWVVKNSLGVVVHSSLGDLVNLTSYHVPAGVLVAATSYTFEVTYHGTTIATSGTGTLAASTSASFLYGGRGVFGGGSTTAVSAILDYITIGTLGNAVAYGSLSVARGYLAATSDGSRGVFGGGHTGAATTAVIDYITIGTLGNAVAYGSLSVGRYNLAATSDGSRGVFGGGYTTAVSAVLDYITIGTLGNAVAYGSLTLARNYLAATSDGSRGVYGGNASISAILDYITIGTLGNAVAYGSLSVARGYLAATSDGSRGVFGGGSTTAVSAILDYITIGTLGNAVAYGSLSVGRYNLAATSDGSRGVFGGGYTTAVSAVLDYITIGTLGNAVAYGYLTVARNTIVATSGG